MRRLINVGLLACVGLCAAQGLWAGDATVQVGPDGFLRINGRGHFVIGMYNAGHYEEMSAAGFSATHNYGVSAGEATGSTNSTDDHLSTLLDRNYTNGLRMMVELPRKAVEKGEWDQVRHRIERFRNHPGLLCWGSEERVARGLTSLTNIVRLYQLVHELDPNHPFVLGDTKDVIKKFKDDRRDFFPDLCMDAGIWWWYPIPLKEKDDNGVDDEPRTRLEPPSWLTTTVSKKPLWIAIQSYEHKSKDGRFPSPLEYRCMAYLSIINGVKGLFFYTGSGQKDYEGKPAGLLNKPLEGHWDYVKSLVHELREFSQVITAAKPTDHLVMAPTGAPIEYTLRTNGGLTYLIAANKSPQPQSVGFKGSVLSGKKTTVLYEKHQAEIQDDVLEDKFEGFGVHVYRLEARTGR